MVNIGFVLPLFLAVFTYFAVYYAEYKYCGLTCRCSITDDTLLVTGTGNIFGVHCARRAIIQEGLTSIGNNAFAGCAEMESVEIPPTVTTIGDYAFMGCEGLKEIKIPPTVTHIGTQAFSGCTRLERITIPPSVRFLGPEAFLICTALQNVTFHKNSSLRFVGEQAFAGCTRLEAFEFPDTVTSIREKTFLGCHSLKNVTIPGSVRYIGEEAFSRCRSLEELTMPYSVRFVDKGALTNCPKLRTVRYCGMDPIDSGMMFVKKPLLYVSRCYPENKTFFLRNRIEARNLSALDYCTCDGMSQKDKEAFSDCLGCVN